MALQKMVDGVCVEMSLEEESLLKAHWAAAEVKASNEKLTRDREELLMKKYPNIYETLDAICEKIGL